ncbi:hypothetical protein FPANT_6383 [Fusarium pseudoanthophilum]|uniref:FAD-binding PCMH-type domain-containing protein n=1 Tax=Fusarium pseudoanthophilum TaxID=48495 RepID=A0A8H5LCJ7_9HYPO|nr:hypothetical protein FPANT_6383 [Fusarium pseudoanthophilum]
MAFYTQPYAFRSSMTLLKSVWLTGWLAALFHSSPINAIALNISHPHSNDLRYLLTNEYHEWSSNTSINFAGSSDFLTSTERWTTFSAPTYAAVISPGTEEDVTKFVCAYPFQKVSGKLIFPEIKLATMHNIPFLATGARHGYTTTLGNLQNGLAIDLSHFKEFELDADAKTVTVGPGVTVGEIFDPLFNAGFDIQTGSAPCPSFIGVTLGGGVGRFQGVYGLLADALISVRLITANGEALEVSRTSYPDLFWAIRGAGANFGVVTSATYSVHPLTNNGDMFLAEFLVPPRRWSEYFRTMESMSPLPAELSSLLLNSFNTTTNQTQLFAHWAYKGPEAEARKHLSPILNMNLTATQMRVLPWSRLVENTFAGAAVTVCEPNTNRNLYTLSMKNYSASTWEAVASKLATFYARYPHARSSSLLYEFFPNQAMAAIPLDETAFPRRDTTAYINLILTSSIHNREMDNALARFGEEIRRDVAATSGYPEITTFVNYAHGDETLEQIYGKDKLPRLTALKKIWDPKEVFSFNNGLPTTYP